MFDVAVVFISALAFVLFVQLNRDAKTMRVWGGDVWRGKTTEEVFLDRLNGFHGRGH